MRWCVLHYDALHAVQWDDVLKSIIKIYISLPLSLYFTLYFGLSIRLSVLLYLCSFNNFHMYILNQTYTGMYLVYSLNFYFLILN